MARIKRIVCYAVNGSGLGHVTRLLSTARWLRRTVGLLERRPPQILFLTSSEATQVLLRAGFASFKLPSKSIVREAGMDMLEYRRLARHFVWHVLGTFSPDMLVVDTFPSGSFDELLQLLDGPFHKGFICRRVKPEYAARPVFQAALGLYDAIAVPHAPEPDQNPLEVHGRPARWCGEVVQIEATGDRGEARARLGVASDRRLVYVSAGGGGDPHSVAALARLVGALGEDPGLHLLVGAGPLYRGPRMGGPHMTWFTEPEIAPYLAACDAAISAGGYNTFHELLHLGVPSVFYAQDKVADDQTHRVAQAARDGACLWLEGGLGDLDAVRGALAQAIERRDALSDVARARVPGGGAARCASALLAGAYEPERLSWADAILRPELVQALESHGVEGQNAAADWLPRLFPAAHVETLSTHPAFVALRGQLSEAAQAEIDAALDGDPSSSAQSAMTERLVALIERAPTLAGGLASMTALVEVAMQKHPIRQESGVEWAGWLRDLFGHLDGLLARPVGHFGVAQVVQLYKVFPRIVDADMSMAFGALRAVLEGATSRGEDAAALLGRLRALKFAHKRVTLGMLAPLIAAEEDA